MEHMAEVGGAKFVSDEAELQSIADRAKLRTCPHCHQLGAMNAHGFLRGYSLVGTAIIVRGRRFFCSNRGNRPGCGRTTSVLLQMMIATFMVQTALLADFVSRVLRGASVRAAWLAASAGALSERSGYRLWQSLKLAVTHLRSQLLRREAPPPSTATEPIGQVLEHMRLCVPKGCGVDLFAVFQGVLQCGLFPS